MSRIRNAINYMRHSGLPFGPFATATEHNLIAVRKASRRHIFARFQWFIRPFLHLGSVVLWPWAQMRRGGLYRLDALWLSADAVEIETVIQAHGREALHNTIFSSDTAGLRYLLTAGKIDPWIEDKLAFYDLCQALGIPYPEVLEPQDNKSLHEQARRDGVIVKPRRGAGGRQVTWLREMPSGQVEASMATEKRRFATLEGGIKQLLAKLPEMIAQAAIRPPKDLVAQQLRLITGREKSGKPRPLFLIAMTKDPGVILDPNTRYDLVDLETGRFHHNSDAILPKQTLTRIKTNATALHGQSSHAALIAFDIICTQKGHYFLEANVAFSLLQIQNLANRPIGDTAIGRILRSYV